MAVAACTGWLFVANAGGGARGRRSWPSRRSDLAELMPPRRLRVNDVA